MKNGRVPKLYAFTCLIPVHCSDYLRMRMPLKKKGRQRKEHAKNKQFGPKRNKKDWNKKCKIA